MLIRDVAPDDLDQLRSAAAEQGRSLQRYLCEVLHAQAAYLSRQDALARTAERLQGRPGVPDDARAAVLDAIEGANVARAGQLSDR